MSGWGQEKDEFTQVTESFEATEVKDDGADHAERVRNANWTQREKFNYDAYNADTREKREAVEAEQDLPAWAHGAARYEWSEEYGDIGPEFPELEKLLFRDDTKTSKGDQYDKLAVSTLMTFIDAKNSGLRN